MWPEYSSVKAVNLVKKSFTVTEIMNFSKGIVFIGTPCSVSVCLPHLYNDNAVRSQRTFCSSCLRSDTSVLLSVQVLLIVPPDTVVHLRLTHTPTFCHNLLWSTQISTLMSQQQQQQQAPSGELMGLNAA